MNNLDEAIKNTAYVLDCLMAYRNVLKTGDCNRCKNRDCGYVPKVGQMVRYNCPFYQPKEGGE